VLQERICESSGVQRRWRRLSKWKMRSVSRSMNEVGRRYLMAVKVVSGESMSHVSDRRGMCC
jgi:hypothetical protein